MYRSTLCSYFHITLLNIMQIKFKHILLFIIICFLIYLDFNWFMSVDFSTVDNANNFVAIHSVGGLVIFLLLILCTNFTYYIEKLLNKNIFKL